ncbi:MAG: hypothetical protein U9N53_15705 [Bacteroidota bacterium]|nr:hypothetical protein [Bacteroidota bacterium]
MKPNNFKVLFLAVIFLLTYSCSKEDEKNEDTGFAHGVFIVNEGAYDSNNGSITHYNKKTSTVSPNIFTSANGRSLGDVVQSFAVIGDIGLIVVNHSQKIEVVDMESFESLGTILGIDYPRYGLGVSDSKAYISDGSFEGYVWVIDLSDLSISNQIVVGKGPENLIKCGNYVFVANSGGWDKDSTLSIIDTQSDQVSKTVNVGIGPTDLVMDVNGDIWVLCKGFFSFDQYWNLTVEDSPRLVRVDGTSFNITADHEILTAGGFFSPNRLAISADGKALYFLEIGGIYKMNITDSNPPLKPFITGNYYGIDVDPANGDIYALPGVFNANGEASVFDKDGILVNSFEAGIGTNAAVFK